jgi:hypothetical protein
MQGDSFYIPPKNYYNLINQKAREAELSLIQFQVWPTVFSTVFVFSVVFVLFCLTLFAPPQYDGPLPTVQPSTAQ